MSPGQFGVEDLDAALFVSSKDEIALSLKKEFISISGPSIEYELHRAHRLPPGYGSW